MKLVRYGPAGKEKPGLIDADGKLRDLSRKVKDIDGDALAPATLAKLRKLDTKKLPLVKGKPRLGAVRDRRVQVRRDRPELRRSREGIGLCRSPSIRSSSSSADLHRRPQRQRHDAEGLDAHRLGSRARHRDRQAPRATSRRRMR